MTGQDQAAPSGKVAPSEANARLRPERVWISASFGNSSIYKRFRVMLHDQPGVADPPDEDKRLLETYPLYTSGQGLPFEDIPTKFCGKNSDTRITSLPDFFKANGYFIVSERCADVFRQFDLGAGGLYPVELYQGNRRTRIDGSYFLLNFGCQKQAFIPEESNAFHLRPIGKLNPTLWSATVTTLDDECAVSQAALHGPDLWIDPRLRAAFFLSDGLAQALRAAKVTRTILMKRCRVLDI